MSRKYLGIAVIAIIAVSAIAVGLIYYSYQNLTVTFNSLELDSPPVTIDETKLFLAALTFVATGGTDLIAFLNSIDTINLLIGLDVRNGGFMPVAVPQFEYDIYINQIPAGHGQSSQQFTISPSQVQTMIVQQQVDATSLKSNAMALINSIVESSYVVNVQLKGDAKLQGIFPLSIPFTVERSINLLDTLSDFLFGVDVEPTVIAAWYLGSQQVQSASNGAQLAAKGSIRFDQPYAGTITVEVKEDLSLAIDRVAASYSTDVVLQSGEAHSFNLPFTAEKSSGSRGYFISIGYSGNVWDMENEYPPRLTVNDPVLSVSSVSWTVVGSPVTSAYTGDTVVTNVTLSVSNADYNGPITIFIRKDLSLALDQDYASVNYSVNIPNGHPMLLSLTWSPADASDSSLRGYFVEVYAGSTKIYAMDNAYPPRLTVSSPPEGAPQIMDAYWKAGWTRVTEVSLGTSVQAHIVIKAVGGAIAGNITFRVIGDIPFWPDSQVLYETAYIDLEANEQIDLYITFTASTRTSISFNGYHMDANFVSWGTTWTMTNSYPPRLSVY